MGQAVHDCNGRELHVWDRVWPSEALVCKSVPDGRVLSIVDSDVYIYLMIDLVPVILCRSASTVTRRQ